MQKWTLCFGDCTEQLQHIAADSVDLVVTSPPYTNQRSATYGGVTPDGYVEWFLPIADELQRVLKPTGTFVLNIKERGNRILRVAVNTRVAPWRVVSVFFDRNMKGKL